jgi:hypothetical protein
LFLMILFQLIELGTPNNYIRYRLKYSHVI